MYFIQYIDFIIDDLYSHTRHAFFQLFVDNFTFDYIIDNFNIYLFLDIMNITTQAMKYNDMNQCMIDDKFMNFCFAFTSKMYCYLICR